MNKSKALLNSYSTVVMQVFCTHLNSYAFSNSLPPNAVHTFPRSSFYAGNLLASPGIKSIIINDFIIFYINN